METLKIDYPCKWSYKIIGSDKEEMQKAVFEILQDKYEMLPSKSSVKGKYHSFDIHTEVRNEEERYRIFFALKECQVIRFVI
ncbi:MAG: DUF493 domain-containing protein [Helicobacter sp.]|nr:DUF493 domain-containing protein [Helicobacter sp.]MBD5168250.1 DUF493 domain-containing protein [Helicobacter sp.]MDE5816760.1 DUF493 domain-containing protein [Helicobacter sp.]MDE6044178.1 DUF493 domain-containing protein [Helicobacter sp.]MDE7196277.1 DUF493 domain-containing protein [Helicobacter sp.]